MEFLKLLNVTILSAQNYSSHGFKFKNIFRILNAKFHLQVSLKVLHKIGKSLFFYAEFSVFSNLNEQITE